jgi:uncharacterized protein (DUF2147 family)
VPAWSYPTTTKLTKRKDLTGSMINNSIHTGKTFATLAVMLMATVVMLQAAPTATAADTTQSVSKKADEQRLIGRWVRSDGGYVLELKEIGKDGTLKAVYLNPRPINVSRAEFSDKDGTLTIFIELRDINYPGSKYNLKYDPGADRLRGTYFQAVQGATYEVEFARGK